MKFTLRPQHRRGNQSGPGISLFPFLAVLICTMGALVPLLLAITRTARLQAEATAAAQAAEQAAKLSVQLRTAREDVQWRVGQLKRSREQTATQLADARLELGHLEDHSRRLRTQLDQYEKAAAAFEGLENADQQHRSQLQTELEQVRRQVGAAEQQVVEARQAAMGRNRSYAIVPYEGPNQTRRRPIYIECRADAVVLQPEGIALTESDFEGPLGPSNPLAAALRAAREYLLARRDFDPQAGEPYPMLLVRPAGITAFYVARAAMKSWGSDFGYELIGDDWKLAYQPPDLRLAEDVRQAITSARVEQEQLIAAAPRHYDRRPKTTDRASHGGGFASEGGGTDDDEGYASATAAGPVGREQGSGFGAQGSGFGGQRPATAGAGGGGSGGVPSAVYGGNSATGGAAGGSGLGGPAVGGQGSGYGGQGTGGGTGSGDGGYNPYVTNPERPATAVAGGGGSGGVPGTVYGGNSGTGTAGQGGGPPPNGAGQVGNLSHDGAGTERPEGYVVGQPPSEQDAPRQPPPPDAVRGQPLRPGQWEPRPEPPPESNHDDKKDDDKFGKHAKPKPVSHRGEDWALREAGRGAVGVTRPMRIECYADRLVVLSDRGRAGDKVVPLGPRTASSIDLLISVVWEQMETWGMAGRGMYWRPVLQVRVAPDAERRFAELSALLEGSGLTIERK